jgi:hypothetical protein
MPFHRQAGADRAHHRREFIRNCELEKPKGFLSILPARPRLDKKRRGARALSAADKLGRVSASRLHRNAELPAGRDRFQYVNLVEHCRP